MTERPSFPGLVALTALLVGVLLIGACSKKPAEPEPQAPVEAVNSDPPNANSLIASKHVLGDPGLSGVILGVESSDGLSTWFRGGLGGPWLVGRLEAGGGLLSQTPLTYMPYGLVVLSSSSRVPGGAIAVGSRDTNGDGKADVSCATLVGPGGDILDQQTYGSDTSTVYVVAIQPLSDSLFVVAGGERTSSRLNPFVALLALTGAGLLEKRQQAVISTIPGRGVTYLATDPAEALASRRRIFLSTVASTGVSTIGLHCVEIEAATLSPWVLTWSQIISGKGVGARLYDMHVLDGALYVAGSVNNPEKGEPAPGVYWTSGILVRLKLAGDIAWARVVNVTGHSEMFWNLEPAADAIIAIGEAASYKVVPSGDAFGYGWVARFGRADGATLSSLTFGDPRHASGLTSGKVKGSTLLAGGWTLHEVADGPYRAWSCILNMGTAPNTPTVGSPARARPGETPTRDTHGPGAIRSQSQTGS